MAPKAKKPITSADLGAVAASAAAGARQALAKGDLNGASVAMLTLSMAVANPSMGGAGSGAHVPSSAAAAAVPAAAEVLTAALERAAEHEASADGGIPPNDDALRAAVEAASISAGCLSALHFVMNDSAEEEKESGGGVGGGEEGGGAPSRFEALEPLAALSRRLLQKIALELSKRGGGKDGGRKDGASKNPWTSKGALNNAASFAAALLEGFYGNRVAEEGEELEAAAKDEEREDDDRSELVVVSPQALTSILDAAVVCEKQKQESIQLLSVDLACAVTSSSAGSGEKLARWGREGEEEGATKSSSGSGCGSGGGAPVVAALARLLGSISPSSSDFAEVRIRNLMALAMTLSAELRLDERKAKKEKEAAASSSSSSSPSAPSPSPPPGARARAALVSAPGAPAALVAAMKQSQDADAKAVARGLFEEVARAEDSKAEMVAALEKSSGAGVDKGVAELALA